MRDSLLRIRSDTLGSFFHSSCFVAVTLPRLNGVALDGFFLTYHTCPWPTWMMIELVRLPNQTTTHWGRGGGLVVSVLAFYFDDLSSNPAGYFNFLFEKTKINQKEANVGPSSQILLLLSLS